MRITKFSQKMGAFALVFCLIVSMLSLLPISAAETEILLPKSPDVDGSCYYPWLEYYSFGYITDDTILHLRCDEDILIQYNELSSEWDDESGEEIPSWSGFGSDLLMPFDTTIKACDFADTILCYLLEGEGYLSDPNNYNWLYFDTNMEIYIVEGMPDSNDNEHVGIFINAIKGIGEASKNAFNSFVFAEDGTVSEECKTALIYMGIALGACVTSGLLTMIFKRRKNGI